MSNRISFYKSGKEVVQEALNIHLINVLTDVVFEYTKTVEFNWRKENFATYGHCGLQRVVLGDKTKEEHINMCFEKIINRTYGRQRGTEVIFCTNDGLGIHFQCINIWPFHSKFTTFLGELRYGGSEKIWTFDFDKCPRDFTIPIPDKDMWTKYNFEKFEKFPAKILSIVQMDGYCELHTDIAVILIDDDQCQHTEKSCDR